MIDSTISSTALWSGVAPSSPAKSIARCHNRYRAESFGVEPDERMAAVARRNGFAIETSRFEEWDPAGHRVDTIIAGQTWHWVDSVAGARKAAQVLDPDGLLVALWNAGDPRPDVAAAFADAYQRIETGLPFTPWASSESAVSGYGRFLNATRDGLEQVGGWSAPERWRFDWEATVAIASTRL